VTYLGNIQRHERHVGLKEWIVRFRNKIKEEANKESPNEYMIEQWEKKISECKKELDLEFNDRSMDGC